SLGLTIRDTAPPKSAVLPRNWQRSSVGPLEKTLKIAPPDPEACVTMLRVKTQSVRTGEQSKLLTIAPPWLSAILLVNVHRVRVGADVTLLKIAPPVGPVLLMNAQSVTVGDEPEKLPIAPPPVL